MMKTVESAWLSPWTWRRRATWQAWCARIREASSAWLSADRQTLYKASLDLRYRAQSGESLDALLIDAYALLAATTEQVHGLRPYDVQLLAAIALHGGAIAEMQTGEGKTLTALFPLFLTGLQGRGAHLVTANDYLAQRDAAWAAPVFAQLGLTVRAVVSDSSADDRRRAYEADVTYATAKEIGFDFLRDRLSSADLADTWTLPLGAEPRMRTVQRDLHFAVVDEADNILIDEARTPLVVSGSPQPMTESRAAIFRWAAGAASSFERERDFRLQPGERKVTLTDAGRRRARMLTPPLSTRPTTRLELYEQLEMALQVAHCYCRDAEYVVRNGEVVIVDEGTGRLAEGRKWRDGLHQAIEAREGLTITEESRDAARITVQSLFRRYRRLSGMTGTVANSAAEIRRIYGLPAHVIPTHRPCLRQGWPDRLFATAAAKWLGIVEEASALHAQGRPVLVGTRSIQHSERVSQLLDSRGIPHQVLNARRLEHEARIIAQGGRAGQVTVATNMAGRGTDIRLDETARRLGGLHVIVSELHDSARLDRQLIGRCARQGDPGSFRFFHSLEDDVLRFGLSPQRCARLIRRGPSNPRELARLAALVRQAQARIEHRHTQARRQLLYRERQRQALQRELGEDPYLESLSDS